MKKTILALFTLAAFTASAQSFYKGALVADAAYGITGYTVQYNTQYIYNGTVLLTQKTTGGAAAKSGTIGVQYGLAKWFGLGLRAQFDNYVTKPDSLTKIKPAANSFEVGLIADFHVVRREHFNLAVGLDLGASHLRYQTNDPALNNMEMYGDGSWADLHITPRYYFGRFGLCASLYFPSINYTKMSTSSANANRYVYSTWKGTGFGMNFGVQYRFLNSR